MAEPKQMLGAIHPGEVLLEDWLKPLGISVNQIALRIQVPASRMYEIVKGRRRITTDTAMRLGRYFQNSPLFWTNLQAKYDLDSAGN